MATQTNLTWEQEQEEFRKKKSVADQMLATTKDPEQRRKIYEATYGYFPGEVSSDNRSGVRKAIEKSPTAQRVIGGVRGVAEIPGLEFQPDLSVHAYNPLKQQPLDKRQRGGPSNAEQSGSMAAGFASSLSNPMSALKALKGSAASKEVAGGARVLGEMTKSKAAAQVPTELLKDPKFGSTLIDAAQGATAAKEAGKISQHALINQDQIGSMVNAAREQSPELFAQGPQQIPGMFKRGVAGMKGALSETPPVVLKQAAGSLAAPFTGAVEELQAEDAAKAGQRAGQLVPEQTAPVVEDAVEPTVATQTVTPQAAPVQSQEEIIKNLMSGNKGLKPYDRGEDGFFDRLNKRVNPATYRKNKLNEEQQFLTNQLLQSEHVDPQTKALLASHNQTREAELNNQNAEQDFGRNVRLEQQQAKGQLVRTQPWAFDTKAISDATGIPEDQIRPEVLSKILGSKLGAYELLQKMMQGQQGVSAQEQPQDGTLPQLDLTR